MKNTLFIGIIFLAFSVSSCTQKIKESIEEQEKTPEAISEREAFIKQLQATEIDERIMQNFLASQKSLQNIDKKSINADSKNLIEKIALENGFDSKEHYEQVGQKIMIVAFSDLAQDKKVRKSADSIKTKIIENLKKDTSSNDSWIGSMVKDIIVENIDSLVKTGELLMNHTLLNLQELSTAATEEERELIKKNTDKIISFEGTK
jgi:vacuolar-type H+-ATPase subunit I/STV1